MSALAGFDSRALTACRRRAATPPLSSAFGYGTPRTQNGHLDMFPGTGMSLPNHATRCVRQPPVEALHEGFGRQHGWNVIQALTQEPNTLINALRPP
jgi:hypothetical protein